MKLAKYGHLICFFVLALSAGSGCQSLSLRTPYEYIEGWKVQILSPAGTSDRLRCPLWTGPERKKEKSKYNLFLLTRSVGVDFSTGRSRLWDSPGRNVGPTKKSLTGHAWLILESPEKRVECGHMHDSGKGVPDYLNGVLRRSRQQHPNPGAYMFEYRPTGKRHGRVRGLAPSFVLRIPITAGQYAAIADFIENYDFSYFAIGDHECTHFVAGAASLAGLLVVYQVRLRAPPELKIRGENVRLWSDPKYRERFVLASPDLLEAHLRRLAGCGIGIDATKGFRD